VLKLNFIKTKNSGRLKMKVNLEELSKIKKMPMRELEELIKISFN
jgi:hypothetical protein